MADGCGRRFAILTLGVGSTRRLSESSVEALDLVLGILRMGI